MTDSPATDPTRENCLTASWDLLDATISAVCVHGQVYNERGLNLHIEEGRSPKLFPINEWADLEGDEPQEFREVLSYELSWLERDSEPPETGRQTEGQIGIVGKLADGRTCKIVGHGFIGRDSLGQLDGAFLKPPAVEIVGMEEEMIEID